MHPEAVEAFACYLNGGGRSIADVARIRGVSRQTVHRWADVFRWKELAAEADADAYEAQIAASRARHLGQLAAALDVFDAALLSRYGEDGKPEAGSPTIVALKAAERTLGDHGMNPKRELILNLTHRPASAVSDADLDRLLAEGNIDALLALNAGADPRTILDAHVVAYDNTPTMPASSTHPHLSTHPEPAVGLPPSHPTPPDFANGQSVGRAGSEPLSPLTIQSEYEEPEPLSPVIDLLYRPLGD